MFNIARLFSYTRRLEDDLRAARSSIAEERQVVEDRHRVEMERLQDLHADESDFLRAQLADSRAERQFLQDRLLQRGGMNPIFEPSPGEIAARTAASTDKKQVLSPRQRAQHQGEKERETLRKQIDEERDQFLEQEKAKAAPASQAAS